MSVHVLLNLLNELRKKDALLSEHFIIVVFCNKFNNLNNTKHEC